MTTKRQNTTRRNGRVVKRKTMRRMSRRVTRVMGGGERSYRPCPQCKSYTVFPTGVVSKHGDRQSKCTSCGWIGYL